MNATKSSLLPAMLLSGAIIVLAFVLLFKYQPQVAEGSTARGSEYQGTTTSQYNGFKSDVLLQNTNGTLGSVVITGAATGVIELYDATTSNITQRGSVSSSSLLLAQIPASLAVGTYTFDRSFYNGLYIHIVGTIPTSTITFRQ